MPVAIELNDSEDAAAAKAVIAGLLDFNARIAGPHGYRPLNLLIRREGGSEIAGGLLGGTSFGWLFVSVLHLPDDLRGTGLGGELLRRAEAEAVARGCIGAHLDTFSFQARPFYERHGYRVFGTIEDMPPGMCRFFMSKRLDGAAPAGAPGSPDHVQS